MKKSYLLFIFIFLGIACFGSLSLITDVSGKKLLTTETKDTVTKIALAIKENNAPNSTPKKDWVKTKSEAIQPQAQNLNPVVLKAGLTAYQNAREKGLDDKKLLTIVDYSKPSNERRLWVIDMNNSKVLFNTWVAHGKNSGLVRSTSFSNHASSLKSSLGVFLTSETYSGHNGYSLRMKGLEHGVNDNAYDRAVVFHGANNVSPQIAKSGRVGRSWGCLAVSRQVAKPLINKIKNDTIVIAYYPDQHWLQSSKFLKSSLV